jgi:hypothetical protein
LGTRCKCLQPRYRPIRSFCRDVRLRDHGDKALRPQRIRTGSGRYWLRAGCTNRQQCT